MPPDGLLSSGATVADVRQSHATHPIRWLMCDSPTLTIAPAGLSLP